MTFKCSVEDCISNHRGLCLNKNVKIENVTWRYVTSPVCISYKKKEETA